MEKGGRMQQWRTRGIDARKGNFSLRNLSFRWLRTLSLRIISGPSHSFYLFSPSYNAMGSNQSNLATKVDLKGKGIKNLEEDLKQPHMLPNFTKLQEISLAKNKIGNIPNSFSQDIIKAPQVAENLLILDLHKNRLTEVPDAVYHLSTPFSRLCFSFYLYSRDYITYFNRILCQIASGIPLRGRAIARRVLLFLNLCAEQEVFPSAPRLSIFRVLFSISISS
jgi:Leucine-rich repeat (LRR) protein